MTFQFLVTHKDLSPDEACMLASLAMFVRVSGASQTYLMPDTVFAPDGRLTGTRMNCSLK